MCLSFESHTYSLNGSVQMFSRRGPVYLLSIYLSIHTYIHTYIHAYMHTCIPAYMHTCIHTCIHTYIHTYITYIHVRAKKYISHALTLMAPGRTFSMPLFSMCFMLSSLMRIWQLGAAMGSCLGGPIWVAAKELQMKFFSSGNLSKLPY